jgi:ketosteroid isomerase-like protein
MPHRQNHNNETAMTSTLHLKEHVQQAANELIAAFAGNDTEAYFAAFSEDATFLFYTLPAPLLSRAAYQEVWKGWQADGFAVLDCQSSNAHISLQGDVAIFMHDVATRVRFGSEENQFHERETIVFRHDDGRWLACHEHLSTQPE